ADNARSIGTEDGTGDAGLMPNESRGLLARIGIPDVNELVIGARDDARAVGAECGRIYGGPVAPLQHCNAHVAGDVPDACSPVLRCRDKRGSVTTKGGSPYAIIMSEGTTDNLPGSRVPNQCRGVQRSRDYVPPIRAERCGLDARVVPTQDHDFLA